MKKDRQSRKRAGFSRLSTRGGFYKAFEDRFRGSRETVRSRLRVYLPFIEPLTSLENSLTATDLGCGRGEWLELLMEHGFDAHGADLDGGMLAACHEKGLRATKQDAIAYLQTLPNESQGIVSGFHIAEHLAFSQLQILVQEALRVLKPAGLLILETPNPENYKVSSLTFYYDPTHRHPLPSELLSFLPEYYGFARTKVIRLQESGYLLNLHTASLDEVLGGASPDYAVVAQKAASNALEQLFDDAFAKDYGLSSQELVGRFDRQLNAETKGLAALELRVDEERKARTALEMRVDQERNARAALEMRVDKERTARAAVEARLAAVYASTSWRFTAPLRRASCMARWFVRGSLAWLTLKPRTWPRRIAKRGFVRLARFLPAAISQNNIFTSQNFSEDCGSITTESLPDLNAEPESVRRVASAKSNVSGPRK